ncbi:helix-turn-helix domain-containing protein [Edaphobacter sp. DSM 109919]|uniref:Helix-turn-helix domain-containing protein n=1 Tax=Edaphobacter paludis TaxID=3035702 RepID=A0AAU7CY32_9BACT
MIEPQTAPGTMPLLATASFVPGVVTTSARTLTSVIDIVRNKGCFWNADELAEVLSISRKHIYKLAKSGRIPCYRMGGAIRFDPEATALWLEKRAIN